MLPFPSHRVLLLILLSTALGLAVALPATAIPITTADGDGADAFVIWTDAAGQTNADTNYGSVTQIRVEDRFFSGVGGTSFNNTQKSWLRFDVSSLGGAELAAAALELAIAPNSDPSETGVDVYGLDQGHPDEAWGESTITWNNAPGNAQHQSFLNTSETTLLGTLLRDDVYPAGEVLSFSSTALVDFLNADTDGLVTIILTGANFDGQIQTNFGSKENTQYAPPTLQLTLVPEPSTALLLGVGLLALPQRRKSTPAGVRG